MFGPFAAGGAAQETGSRGEWSRPASGPVVRPFAEPLALYAAGHRGVDFAAARGSAVRAANDGVVSFAGDVAGTLHVVVSHDGGIRTSYSFLLGTDVRVGQRVQRGDVVGTAGGAGDGHAAGVLHFGVRVGERYIDPMLLFRPRDLTQIVRLVPAHERDAVAHLDLRTEIAAIVEWLRQEERGDDSCGGIVGYGADLLGIGAEAASLCDALGDVVDDGLDALRSLGPEAARLADEIGPVVTEVVRRMKDLGEGLAEAAEAVAADAAAEVERVVRALVAFAIEEYERWASCPQPDPISDPAGSGNLVMAVAGRGSRRRARADRGPGPSFDFKWRVLGYQRTDVFYFSYEASSVTYGPRATYGDLHEKARLLGEQIKAAALAQPGRHIDLVGHSQGGVVIDLFLMEVYRGHKSEYPPIDNVVTFASPHEGTPAASIGSEVGRSVLSAGIRAASALGVPEQGLDSESLEQISMGSETMRALWSGRQLPPEIRPLSIVGSHDLVVPSSVGDIPGGNKIVVPVGSALDPRDDHSGILSDPDALSAAQAQLSGAAPVDSCGPLTDIVSTGYTAVAQAAADVIAGRRPLGSPLVPPSPFPVVGAIP